MRTFNYPFEQAKLNKETKILIDTCFLLSLLYDKDPKNTECIDTFKTLILKGCKLFVNDIVIAEFINQMQKKMFVNDIKSRGGKNEIINSRTNINLIVACFSKNDRKIIREHRYEKYHHIPFNKYFYNIAKNPWKRDLLKVYYEKAVEMHSQVEKSMKLRYIAISKECIELSMEFMKKFMLSVNDAYHLACAEYGGINYLLTLDCDFEEIRESSIDILKI